MAITAVPGIVFAEEVEVASEEAVVVESDETDQAVFEEEEAVEVEEIAVEETDEPAAETADSTDEFTKSDSAVPSYWDKPTAYTIGTKAEGKVYPSSHDGDNRHDGKFFTKTFYKFKTQKNGFYKLTAHSDHKINYILTTNPDYYPEGWASKDTKTWERSSNPDLNTNNDLNILADTTVYVIVDGDIWYDYDEIDFWFQLDLVREAPVYDQNSPELINLNKKTTLEGELNTEYTSYMPLNDTTGLNGLSSFYTFTVTTPGRLNFTITTDYGVDVEIFDAPHWRDLEDEKIYWHTDANETGQKLDEYKDYADLTTGSGPYNLRINLPGRISQKTTHYKIEIDFRPINAKGGELIADEVWGGSRNSETEAKTIFTDKKYFAQSAVDTRTKTNWYKLVLTAPSELYLSLSSTEISSMSFCIKDGMTDISTIDLEGSDWGTTPTKAIEGRELIARYKKYTKVFPRGTYYIGISKWTTGSYSFELSTGSKVKVTGVTLNKKATTVALNGTDTLVATVKPANADNKNVSWEVVGDPEQETIRLTPNEDGSCEIKGLISGVSYKVKVTASNPDVFAICEVDVLDYEIQQRLKEDCENVVATQKVNLSGNDYFGYWGDEFNKDDKFLVEPAKAGKVSKGIFTAGKAEGEVTITRQIRVGKTYLNSDKVKFDLKQPKVRWQKNDKGKEIKFFTATYEGQELNLNDLVDKQDANITGWQISDKKGNFELLDGGKIQCNKNGTNTKITPLFGAEKTPGNITFTLKTVTPKLSATKKLKQQTGQSFVLKLSNCTGSSEIEWKFEADPTDTRVAVQTDAVTIEEVKADKPTKLQKKININKAVSGKIVATVDGHTYECAIEVVSPEIKKAAQTLKVGKAGAVGVKNTKIKDITWTTSDSSKVEIVDAAKGKIKAVAPGTATISAEIGGVPVSCEVTVTE